MEASMVKCLFLLFFFVFISSPNSPWWSHKSSEILIMLAVKFFSKLTLDQRQDRELKWIGRDWKTSLQEKTLMVLLLLCKWSLIIPHEHAHTKTHTFTHTSPSFVYCCGASLAIGRPNGQLPGTQMDQSNLLVLISKWSVKYRKYMQTAGEQ